MELILGTVVFIGVFVWSWLWFCEKMGWLK